MLAVLLGPSPHPVVIDSDLRCPLGSKLMQKNPKPVIACTANGLGDVVIRSSHGAEATLAAQLSSPASSAVSAQSSVPQPEAHVPGKAERLSDLVAAGAVVLVCNELEGRVDLCDMLGMLMLVVMCFGCHRVRDAFYQTTKKTHSFRIHSPSCPSAGA